MLNFRLGFEVFQFRLGVCQGSGTEIEAQGARRGCYNPLPKRYYDRYYETHF
jgi:hypothetical protein